MKAHNDIPKQQAETPLSGAMVSAIVQQSVIMILASMILDGGGIAQVCLYALLAFWSGVAVLRIRSKGPPSKVDLALVRGGFILVCLLSFFITRLIWRLRGFDVL